MNLSPPPFSEPVRLNQIGAGLTRVLTPDEAARGRIAASLDLIELPQFTAEVVLAPTATGWRLSGRLAARAVQRCGVTLEPLPVDVDETFVVDLIEPDPRAPVEVEVTLDEDGPDTVENGVVDLGGYAVEHLALALDPFPRKPGAVFEPPESTREESPFAVLKRFGAGEPSDES